MKQFTKLLLILILLLGGLTTSYGLTVVATTSTATSVTSTSATLNGSINANEASTIVTFEYGTTTGYGITVTVAQSPVTGTPLLV